MSRNQAESPSPPSTRPEATTSDVSGKQTRGRTLGDIEVGASLTMDDVLHIWGPCDRVFGSGIQYWVYELDDGRTLVLLFDLSPPYALFLATVADQQQNVTELFNAMTTTRPASNPSTQR